MSSFAYEHDPRPTTKTLISQIFKNAKHLLRWNRGAHRNLEPADGKDHIKNFSHVIILLDHDI
jgi:hypothetical protein